MFLLACRGGAAGDFILYIDDVRIGNILRPDPGRVHYSILWSLAQYPRRCAAMMMGWLPLCFVQSTQLDRIDGGISQVIAALLQVLWDANAGDARRCARLGPAMNLASLGVRIPLRGAHRIIKLVFRAILADEKGLHEVCMSKTASGIKPCVCCMNIIGRRRPADIAADWAIHFSQAGPDDFRRIRRGILRTHAGRSAPRDGRSSQQGERQEGNPNVVRHQLVTYGRGPYLGSSPRHRASA